MEFRTRDLLAMHLEGPHGVETECAGRTKPHLEPCAEDICSSGGTANADANALVGPPRRLDGAALTVALRGVLQASP